MRISDWSSDVCSSDLAPLTTLTRPESQSFGARQHHTRFEIAIGPPMKVNDVAGPRCKDHEFSGCLVGCIRPEIAHRSVPLLTFDEPEPERSEEHTSALQSLISNSYAVYCLKKKQHTHN